MKLIAFDIDGTSIKKNRRVAESTLRILQQLHDDGYILVPTTGRSLDGIPKSIKALNICDYAISSNGAVITNLKTGETLAKTVFSPERAAKVLDIIRPYRLWTSLHIENECYDSTWLQKTVRRVFFHGDFLHNRFIHNPAKYVREHQTEVEKIQVFSLSKHKLKRLLKELDVIADVAYPMSSKNYYEITNKGAEKGIALTELCQHLNVPLTEVFAIGDDVNDISMLRVAGISVAMGNAKPEVASEAMYVTGSNNENGFANAFQLYLYNQKEA
ncbi:HAD family phosphatase [Erysipelothrix sp. HDW6C]|uniref:Cof-type HAD-IIB family hydrolase n=1 Tax=Erysipelothrix sp. HDW6C TaxID=2714930 RepID=UPI0014074A0D|nr:Cof-type HAD-IIB family hydrolase [Erysipelothrix sp. HDW6C]QIK69820.1 HAD family phosphatase [Erysipelothrix sp. HDW6C]